jgi:hypothetical protein
MWGICLVGVNRSTHMMNLEDVPDMNVGDMVNEYTSGVNVSYMIHSIILLSFIRHVIII